MSPRSWREKFSRISMARSTCLGWGTAEATSQFDVGIGEAAEFALHAAIEGGAYEFGERLAVHAQFSGYLVRDRLTIGHRARLDQRAEEIEQDRPYHRQDVRPPLRSHWHLGRPGRSTWPSENANSGPIFITADGRRSDRHGASGSVRRVARRAEISRAIGPHSLRHAFITAALDAGVPLRDVQEAASHADPRTTMRYDRARVSLDRHATYIVSTYIAGAAR